MKLNNHAIKLSKTNESPIIIPSQAWNDLVTDVDYNTKNYFTSIVMDCLEVNMMNRPQVTDIFYEGNNYSTVSFLSGIDTFIPLNDKNTLIAIETDNSSFYEIWTVTNNTGSVISKLIPEYTKYIIVPWSGSTVNTTVSFKTDDDIVAFKINAFITDSADLNSDLVSVNRRIINMIFDSDDMDEDGFDIQEVKVYNCTSNGNFVVEPSEGYEAMKKVNVSVDVPSDINNQGKTVYVTTNGTNYITPDSSHTGLSYVNIFTNVKPDLGYYSHTFNSNGYYTFAASEDNKDGYVAGSITVDVPSYINNQDKTVNISSNGTQTISADSGYSGLGEVSITTNIPSDINNQNKTLTVTQNGTRTITTDNGYSGIGSLQLTTNVPTQTINNQVKDVTINENNSTITIEPDNGYTGLSAVDITTEITPNLETKYETYESNGIYYVNTQDGYDGISTAEITVDVPSDINNQDKTVNISSNGTQTISADSGYSGLGEVSIITNVPNSINNQTLSIITYTTNGTRILTPSSGYTGIDKATINVDVHNTTPECNIIAVLYGNTPSESGNFMRTIDLSSFTKKTSNFTLSYGSCYVIITTTGDSATIN
eukprot:jgi/Orpsp1_1/1185095/evm.model.c7180000092267.1